jgi:hypothetical protein
VTHSKASRNKEKKGLENLVAKKKEKEKSGETLENLREILFFS